jgi:putative ABC transport system permease protein
MPEELGKELAAMPGVSDIETVQFVSGSAGEQGVVIVVREFADPDNVPLDLREGDARDLRKKLIDGQVVIGTALSQRAGLRPGDDVVLATKEGQRSFRIAGTANTYTVGGMAVYMQREVARRYLNTTGASAFVITATPESRIAVHEKLSVWSAEHGLILQSFTELAEAIDRGLARVLAALWALLSLALVVTAFGIANTLSMNVMEQTRELGMLRTVGMTRKQIRRLVIAQALIMGALGLIPGGLAGVAVGYVVNLATSQQFGHRMEFVFHPALWIGSLAAALVIVLGAAWLPGRRAANLDILRALQYE